MNILKALFGKQPAHKSVGPPPTRYMPQLMRTNHETSNRNPIVYRCIKLIAQNIASIPIIPPENIKVAKLLRQPNSTEEFSSLIEKVVSALFVHGRIYLLLREPEQLQLLYPYQVTEQFNELGLLCGYSYTTMKGTKFEPITPEGCCNVLAIKYNDPFNRSTTPLSPCELINESVKLYNSITACNQAIMDNAARFSGALIINGNHINEYEIENIRKSLEEKTGYYQAGKTIILQGNLKWEQMKINAADADYTKLQEFVAREIMQGLGVPAPMLGLNDTGFHHYKEARIHFWEDTLLPLARQIFGALSKWFSTHCKEEIRLQLNLKEVPAFADKVDNRIQIMAMSNFLTDEEKRNFCGLNL